MSEYLKNKENLSDVQKFNANFTAMFVSEILWNACEFDLFCND